MHVELPGMLTAVAGAILATLRSESNLWWLALADDPAAARILDALGPTAMPSEALTQLGPDVTVAKLELDVCGAWLTVANAGEARPVVVRRAGWVDLRGHPGRTLTNGSPDGPADDRVGLGPGDVLVLQRGTTADVNSDVIDACLGTAGDAPVTIAKSVQARVGGRVAAIGVPSELGGDPLVRVAEATGVSPEDVRSPGYPLGDLQPDLWKKPPHPPRVARLRLTPDRASVKSVRSLLDRLLASWRLDGRLDPHDVKLVATELAANAIVHSGTPETVTVRYTGDVVRIEVEDRSSQQPKPRDAAPDAINGRGMQLIEALGAAWGTEDLDDGKRVWCDLAVAAA